MVKELILKKAHINTNGIVKIQEEKLWDYFLTKPSKLPILINPFKTKILTGTNLNDQFSNSYYSQKEPHERAYLFYDFIKENDKYYYSFDFSQSKSLSRFKSHSFQIYHQKSNEEQFEYIVFDFSDEIDGFNPRRSKVRIRQGTLKLANNAPPQLLSHLTHLIDKKRNKSIPYAVTKLFSFPSKETPYDLLISFNQDSIETIKHSLGGDISQCTGSRLYLKKKKFDEFVKRRGNTYLTAYIIDDSIPNDFFEVITIKKSFHDNIFKDYRIENISNQELDLEKKESMKRALLKLIYDLINTEPEIEDIDEHFRLVLERLKINNISSIDLDLEPKNDALEMRLYKKHVTFELDEYLYDKYLLKEKIYNSMKEVNELKKSSLKLRGFSEYFLNVKNFIEIILNKTNLTEEEKYFNDIQAFRNVDINQFDFENLEKRKIYWINPIAIFMDNYDILLTYNEKLKLDYSLDLVEEEIKRSYEKGFDIFNNKHEAQIKEGTLEEITDKEYTFLGALIKDLRLASQKEFNPNLIRDSLYYSSIFKTIWKKDFQLFINRYHLKQSEKNLNLAFILGLYNAYMKYHPEKQEERTFIINFFTAAFLDFTELERKTAHRLLQDSRVLLLLFLAAEALKKITAKCANLLVPHHDIKEVLSTIESELKGSMKTAKELTTLLRKAKEILSNNYNNPNEFEDAKKTLKKLFTPLQAVKDELSISTIRENVELLLEKRYKQHVELEMIRELSGKYITVVYQGSAAKYSVLAAGAFSSFVKALDLNIPISLISNTLHVDPTTIQRQVIKMAWTGVKKSSEIKSLKLNDKEFIELLQHALVKFLIYTLVKDIKMTKNSQLQYIILEQLLRRLHFFLEHEVFIPALELIKEELLSLGKNIIGEQNKIMCKKIQSLFNSTDAKWNRLNPSYNNS